MEDPDIESTDMLEKVKLLSQTTETEELEEKRNICVHYSSNPFAKTREFDCNFESTGSPKMVMKPASFHSAYELYTLGMFPHLRNGNSWYYPLVDLDINDELTSIASHVLQNDPDGADLLARISALDDQNDPDDAIY